ncbi:hypothetical protein I350_08156 [Cryptococcus amylolentus CBS 6273]|uniref:Uncharacterized protein n=1 Tax=Cryptococcus amylolentus CBS 6273 TaxID=1296118 RepID=A0A1E3JAN2_9TREE|nr:hypothetical protein I350_08156 [Cryptococcus amylolentus CBS 6273]
MDMVELGMDTAWCLACSKQLDNPKSTYCSDVCRHQDSLPLEKTLDVAEITWPSSIAPHSTKTNGDRPTVQPSGPFEEVLTGNQFRGRRAYSFPAHQTQEAPLLPGSRRQTQTQETLQFIRKSHRVSATLSHNASPHLGPVVAPKASKGFGKLSKTTGDNTPLVPDSVFCSNSESSDNECVGQSPRNIARRMSSKSARGDYLSETIRLPRAPVPRRFSVNLMMEPGAPRARPALEPAYTLPIALKPSSPVARMVATSAGSRSREDIVSWLNEVKCLPNQADGDTDLSFNRHDTITPTQERVEWVGENGLSTTPQGRFGSALAGLSTIRGFSAVRAFASAAGSNPPTTTASAAIAAAKNPEMPSTIQATPSQAEVSRVAVTAVSTEHDDSGYVTSHVGATPTLSTISLSEVMDPLTDGGENVDFFSDEQSANGDYSYVQRRLSAAITGPNAPKSGDESAKLADPPKASSAIRPLTNTARAIWSFSNYLRSFAPLSISSVAPSPRKAQSPISPKSSTPAKPPSPRAHTSPSSILHDQPKDISIAPMPTAHQPPPPEPESPVKEMVRSLPMNIVHPAGMENVALERRVQREQEAEMGMDAHWSPSKSRSRARGSAKGSRVRAASPSRSRSRGRSQGRRSRAREMSKVRRSHSRHGRKVSYDADASGEDEPEDDDARGRSRRPRGLRMESMEDDRRGRDRTVKA